MFTDENEGIGDPSVVLNVVSCLVDPSDHPILLTSLPPFPRKKVPNEEDVSSTRIG